MAVPDDDGVEEWYVVTVSVAHRVILRVQHDDLGAPRHLLLTPFPHPTSVYGYSYAENYRKGLAADIRASIEEDDSLIHVRSLLDTGTVDRPAVAEVCVHTFTTRVEDGIVMVQLPAVAHSPDGAERAA